MVYTPQTYYRNEECRKLAERVERGAAYETLDIKVNIEQVLDNRQSDVPILIHQAIEENCNFVLFSDENHYIIIIPCKLAVACYVNGVQGTLEQMNDMQQFQNRIKIAFVVYDKFYRLDRHIESGRPGDGAIPLHTDREDMSDGEKREGESQAIIPDEIV